MIQILTAKVSGAVATFVTPAYIKPNAPTDDSLIALGNHPCDIYL